MMSIINNLSPNYFSSDVFGSEAVDQNFKSLTTVVNDQVNWKVRLELINGTDLAPNLT